MVKLYQKTSVGDPDPETDQDPQNFSQKFNFLDWRW
jgi:hypothetical protein